MRQRIRSVGYAIVAIVLVTVCGLMMPRVVKAATYYNYNVTEGDSAGGYYLSRNYSDGDLYYRKTTGNGKEKRLVKTAAKETLGDYVLFNGTYVYYTIKSEGASETAIYRKKLGADKTKKVMGYPSKYGEMVAYSPSNKKVILGKSSGSHLKLYSYIKGKKPQRFTKKTSSVNPRQCGSVLLWGHPDIHEIIKALYSYNIRTGKSTTITKNGGSCDIIGSYVYYSEEKQLSSGSYSYTIKRAKLNGSEKKQLGSWTVNTPVGYCNFGTNYAVGAYGNSSACRKFTYGSAKPEDLDFHEFENLYFGLEMTKGFRDGL